MVVFMVNVVTQVFINEGKWNPKIVCANNGSMDFLMKTIKKANGCSAL